MSVSRRGAAKRITAVLLIVIILMSLTVSAFGAGSKQTKTRAIGIVFDNSGSMYVGSNSAAWCRATYAIEVFASMMNSGDVLQVYPMCTVTARGQTYDGKLDDEAYFDPSVLTKPVTVNAGDDVTVIRDIYTPLAGGTPIETIDDAYAGLQNANADEKWLIVLTDGTTFHVEGVESSRTPTELAEKLSQYNAQMNVLYLGIGSGAAMPDEFAATRYQYYADKANSSTDVLSKLTSMCNMIFGRDTLAANGDTIEFDVSMSKLILFVQGEGVSDIKLVDSTGAEVTNVEGVFTPRYSEAGCGNYDFDIDTSLQGVITTYGECDKGTYTLQYSGSASNISVYYEPDVDLVVELVNEEGNVVTDASAAYAGAYTLRYGLVDKDGNLTESALLGDTHYEITYEINGTPYTVTSDDKSGEIELDIAPGDMVDVTITANYLSGYSITKSSKDGTLGAPFASTLNFPASPVGELRLEVSGGSELYSLSQLEEQAWYTMEVYYKDEQITGDLLDSVTIAPTFEGGELAYSVSRDGDTYVLSLKPKGAIEDVVCGPYTMTIGSSYINEDAITVNGTAVVKNFEIDDDGFAFKAEFDLSQSYYMKSNMDKGDPIMLVFTKDGVKLTPEELAAVAYELDMDGVEYTAELVPEESALEITLVKSDSVEMGTHKISASASIVDPVGRELSASDTAKFQIRPYPAWLPWLIALIILAVLAFLIYLYLNDKVLPKKVYVTDTNFAVDGNEITGDARVEYRAERKKKGRLSVESPSDPSLPIAKCRVTFNLEARDTRFKVLKARLKHRNGSLSAIAVKVDASNTVNSVNCAGETWTWDENHQKVEPIPTSAIISYDEVCTVMGEAMDGDGGMASILFTFNIKYK